MTLNPNTARIIGKPALALSGLTIPNYDNVHDIKAARPAGCVGALITVELASGSVRVNVTGQDPRGGNGHVIAPGSRITLEHPDEVDKFRVALENGTSATLIVTYF